MSRSAVMLKPQDLGPESSEVLRPSPHLLDLAMHGSGVGIFDARLVAGELEPSRFTLFNVWELLGYDPDDLDFDVRKAAERILTPNELPRLQAEAKAQLGTVFPHFMLKRQVRHRDGSLRWLLARGTILRGHGGVASRLVGNVIDITELTNTEDRLRDSERRREAAEQASSSKDAFLANTSHEIRTPLNAILALTKLTLDSVVTDDQRRLLSTAHSAGKKLVGIVDELLDLSKIAAGKLTLDEAPFSLRTELEDALQTLNGIARSKALELVSNIGADVPDALFGDAGRLRQILMNLVGNAIKFTSHGKIAVLVTMVSGPADRTTLRFRIIDTGIGIPTERHQAIFRAFEQADASTTRKYGGTGLGLTISARLAKLLGGAIAIESRPGHGSTFELTVSFRRSATGLETVLDASASAEPRAFVPAGLRVLVAEDNELNTTVLEALLKRGKHHARFVGDGRAALAAAAAGDFDLLLLDLQMPEMDGFQVVRALREQERLTDRHLPVIALTARASELDRDECFATGMDGFVSKPIDPDALWAVVARLLAAKSL